MKRAIAVVAIIAAAFLGYRSYDRSAGPERAYESFAEEMVHHRYDHAAVTTLLLVTTEETRLEDLLARKVAVGDIGATANTILVMGSERVGNRVARLLSVVKHRGSAMSDKIVEYRIGSGGLELG